MKAVKIQVRTCSDYVESHLVDSMESHGRMQNLNAEVSGYRDSSDEICDLRYL
jgi:hypothetical protein